MKHVEYNLENSRLIANLL